MQFKAGDRVRIVDRHSHDRYWVQVGREFVIEDVDDDEYGDLSPSHHPYLVKFRGESDWLATEQLELVSDSTDTLTVYKLQVPEEPAGVDRVRPVGHEWMRYERMDTGDWVREDSSSLVYDWQELLKMHPEGVEPVPAERDFEVSLDYLRRNAHLLDGLEASGVTGSHAAAVVRGVLEREGSE